MKTLLIVAGLCYSTTLFASFLDCRSSYWYHLSIDLPAEEAVSEYIKKNERQQYTRISNSKSEPLYVLVNGLEVFKLADDKVYEPRQAAGLKLGWKRSTDTFRSDTGKPNQTFNLSSLIINQKTLSKFGVKTSSVDLIKTKVSQCGPNRPLNEPPTKPIKLSFHLKIKNKLYKVKGHASILVNKNYAPIPQCCK